MGFFNSLFGNKPQAAPSTAPTVTTQKKILIVEDDKDIRDFYTDYLTSEGYATVTAENGELGLNLLNVEKPDLVLLDLMMPVMDGKTMLHNMRKLPEGKTTPVIVLTNAGDADSIRQTKFFDNANDFVIKANITPDQLLAKIKSLI